MNRLTRWRHHRLQKWMLAFCVAMALCLAGDLMTFAQECAEIRQEVFRLHILANSDSEQDQALKLLVRDAILAESQTLFLESADKNQAMEQAENALSQMEEIANQTLAENGSDQTATVSIEYLYFTTRYYEDYTLPAGYYDALRVEIGDAAGANWWCVLYPALCISAATQQEQVDTVFDDTQKTIVTGGDDYQISFAIVEWLEEVKAYWKGAYDVTTTTG